MTGWQLTALARQALNAGQSGKAEALARKAVAKGGGGTAYYVLGAAQQLNGSPGGAKQSYRICAKTGAPEAGECAALAESL
jgi:hypothetical protein